MELINPYREMMLYRPASRFTDAENRIQSVRSVYAPDF